MNKIQTTLSAAIFSLSVLPATAIQAAPDPDDGRPLVYGVLNFAAIDKSAGDDLHVQAKEAAFGIRGIYKDPSLGGIKIPYRLELEATKAINNSAGEDIIEIKNAVIAMPSSYGTLVLAARGESGQQRDIYGAVDIFDVYEANRNGGLYDQPDEASGIIAYVSPEFGGFQITMVNLNLGTANDDNEEASDANAVRLMYRTKQLTAGVGYVTISDKVVPTEDYNRVSATAKYSFDGGHTLGTTYEQIKDQPGKGDFETIGVAGSFKFGAGMEANIGHFSQNSDQENSATVLSLRKHLNKRVYAYAEVADFDEPDLGHVAVGMQVAFRGTP